MRKFLSCKLKRKVIWEAFLVAFHGLNQDFCRNLIKFCKLLVGQNFFATNQKNKTLNPFQRYYFCAFAHVFELRTILKPQILIPSFVLEMPIWNLKFDFKFHFTFNSRWMPNFSMRLRSVARVMPSSFAA